MAPILVKVELIAEPNRAIERAHQKQNENGVAQFASERQPQVGQQKRRGKKASNANNNPRDDPRGRNHAKNLA